MQKKVYFLTGFPRSGNTLLAKILNQNKDIGATGHSSLPDVLFNLDLIKLKNTYNNFKSDKDYNNIITNIFNNYYKDWPQKYIIDRGEWATPANYALLLQYFPQDIKIIFLLRNPTDVIKSYIKLCNDHPNFYINRQYNELDITSLHRTELEEKIELITKKEDLFDWSFMAYNFIKNKKNVHFVKYEDLVENPEKTLNNIYTFLEIPKFKHNFNIKDQFFINGIKYDDSVMGAPMHTLHTGKLKNFGYPNIKLPKYILEKYKGVLYDY